MTDSPCTTITAQLAKMTAGDWHIEGCSITNRDLDGPEWDSNDDGRPSWDVAEVYAPANATGIVQAHRVYKFLGSEGAVGEIREMIRQSLSHPGQAAEAIFSFLDNIAAKGDGE